MLTADLLWGRWTEATVADFVSQLGARPDAGTLSLAVRRALGDPTAAIGFWLADQGRYVDDRGAPFDPPTDRVDRSMIEVEDAGEPAAVLVHDAARSYDQQLITEVTTALTVALDNARLQAHVRAGVVELGRSRRRLVEAADAQRRKFDADLADGPQRATVGDGPTGSSGPRRPATLSSTTVSERLRPKSPGRRWSCTSLPSASGRRCWSQAGWPPPSRLWWPGPARPEVRLNVTPDPTSARRRGCGLLRLRRGPRQHRQARPGSTASIDVITERGFVVARIADLGRGGADSGGSGLRGLRDRVEALDGTFILTSPPGGGTSVTARIRFEGDR